MKKILLIITIITVNYTLLPYAYLKDEARLNEVLLAIAHNSPYSTAYGWKYAQQDVSVEGQWEAGMRGAEIKTHWRYNISNTQQIAEKAGATKVGSAVKSGFNKVTSVFGKKDQPKVELPFIGLCHEGDLESNCFVSATIQKDANIMSLTDYFKKITALIEKNPQDIAVFFIADQGIKSRSTLNRAEGMSDDKIKQEYHAALAASGIGKYTWVIDPKATQPWPTIGEMRNVNKRVVIFSESALFYPGDTILSSQAGLFAFTGSDDVYGELHAKACKLSGRSAKNPSAFYVSFSTEMSVQKDSIKGKVLGALPVKKVGGVDLKPNDYNKLNSKDNILNRINNCQESNKLRPSVLAVDFIEKGQVAAAVEEINKNRGVIK